MTRVQRLLILATYTVAFLLSGIPSWEVLHP